MAETRNLQRKIMHFCETERERFVLWVPVWIALGAGLYFSLSQEPSALFCFMSLAGSMLVLIGGWNYVFIRYAALTTALVLSGFLTAKIETIRMQAPVLPYSITPRPVIGIVEQIDILPEGAKLLLSDVSIADIPSHQTPRKIRITLKFTPLVKAGDKIAIRAGLFPPSAPVMPGGFDFARHFYFQQIGAIGFGIQPLHIMSETEETGWKQWNMKRRQMLEALRQHISARIRSALPEPYGAIAEGFITGETSSIPQEVDDAMRAAGLAHLLAVSGMNLAMVAGIVFFMVRFILATIPPLALRIHIKKWAAAAALIASYGYLLLANSPVSAERAFIMAALLLVAIMIDRTPSPMRSVMLAATALLLFVPHTLLGAGFQLSFAATLALIAFYEHFSEKLHARMGARKIAYYISGAFFSALVAGLATAPYTLYHFNQMASYTLPANMLADPIVAFWVMPCAVLALMLMPLGLEWLALWPMQWGIKIVLSIAYAVQNLPHAALYLPAISTWGLVFITLGGLWLCLWQSRIRFAGVICIIIGLSSMFTSELPYVLIADDGKQIAIRNAQNQWMLIKGRKANFASSQWLEKMGQKEFLTLTKDKSGIWSAENVTCDTAACNVTLQDIAMALVHKREALAEECRANAVIIAPTLEVSRAECGSPHLLISKTELNAYGAQGIWLNNDGLLLRTVRPESGQRPWSAWKS